MVVRLSRILDHLATSSDGKVVRLCGMKRRTIIGCVAKLPYSTGMAYTQPQILLGFHLNGQLDKRNSAVPTIDGILNTYRGEIKGTYLEDKKRLIREFYSPAFENGMIDEKIFDNLGVPYDKDSSGAIVLKTMGFSQENQMR